MERPSLEVSWTVQINTTMEQNVWTFTTARELLISILIQRVGLAIVFMILHFALALLNLVLLFRILRANRRPIMVRVNVTVPVCLCTCCGGENGGEGGNDEDVDDSDNGEGLDAGAEEENEQTEDQGGEEYASAEGEQTLDGEPDEVTGARAHGNLDDDINTFRRNLPLFGVEGRFAPVQTADRSRVVTMPGSGSSPWDVRSQVLYSDSDDSSNSSSSPSNESNSSFELDPTADVQDTANHMENMRQLVGNTIDTAERVLRLVDNVDQGGCCHQCPCGCGDEEAVSSESLHENVED